MDDKLNVIILNDYDYVEGGASNVALHTADILYHHGINVVLFSCVKIKDKPYRSIGIDTHDSLSGESKIKGAISNLYNRKAEKEFKKLLDDYCNKNTIIHVHTWTKGLSSSPIRIAIKKGFRVVLTMHDYFTVCPNGGLFNYNSLTSCELNPLSLKCIKCNCDSRNYVFKLYRCIRQMIQNKTLHNNKITYLSISDFSERKIAPFLHSNQILRLENPRFFNKTRRCEAEKNKYYIYIGRISKEKGVGFLCEAFSKIDASIVIVGDGPELMNLKHKYSNQKNINFKGWKNSYEVKRYLTQSKALIFPSFWYEGSPLTIQDALSNGIPCIISSNTAATDYIKHDFNGLIFQNSNIHDLITKISDYENADIKQLSENTYLEFWNESNKENDYYTSLINVYEMVMNQHG